MDNNKNIDVENTENIEIFESDFDLVADEFCQKLGLENLTQASQSQWNAYLIKCNRDIISNVNIKMNNYRPIENSRNNISSNDNAYDINKCMYILDNIYIPSCMMYSKEISIMGYSLLIGCEYDTIMRWSHEVGSSRQEIYKKLISWREESLSNKLSTGKQNPVGIMAILNHHYSWNMPGVRNENTSKQALTSKDLPMLNCTENGNNSDTANE